MSVDLLQRFIAFPTVSRDPLDQFATELAERAESLGGRIHQFKTSEHKHNVVAHFGPEDTDGLGLSGHMDVVPVDGQNWSVNPFGHTIDNGRIIGRGACDMKGFIANVYTVLPRLDLSKLRKGLTLIWTHDEELGCMGASHLQHQAADLVLPQQMLIGEPTSGVIFHHHGGHTTIEFSVLGYPAHSSKPHLGKSASNWLFEIWSTVREWDAWLQSQPSPITGVTPITNVAQLSSGTAVNIIPEHAWMQVGLRPMPGHQVQPLIAELQQRVQIIQKTAQESGVRIEMNIIQSAPPMFTNVPNDLSKAIQQQQPSAKCTGAPFATDGGCLAEMGCEPLIWGPGSIDVAHQANEYVRIEELLQYEHQLESLIRQWCF
jgi:acetylornithine deacetylase